jgi:hypothetical protein
MGRTHLLMMDWGETRRRLADTETRMLAVRDEVGTPVAGTCWEA